MPFRLKAKNLFLTYPQCLEEPQGLIDFLLEKLESKEPLYIVVSQEEHEDGTPHLHAFISLNKTLDTRNARFFDSGDIHGNYQAANDPKAVYQYVIKDGNLTEWGDCPGWICGRGAKESWDEVCLEAFSKPTRQEAEEVFRTKAPGRYTSSYLNVKARLDSHYRPIEAPYLPPHEQDHFQIPQVLSDWYTANLMVSVLRSLTRTRFSLGVVFNLVSLALSCQTQISHPSRKHSTRKNSLGSISRTSLLLRIQHKLERTRHRRRRQVLRLG